MATAADSAQILANSMAIAAELVQTVAKWVAILQSSVPMPDNPVQTIAGRAGVGSKQACDWLWICKGGTLPRSGAALRRPPPPEDPWIS